MRLTTPTVSDRTHLLLLAVFSFLILFVPLHRGDLSGYDDALYAREGKEIIQAGDWWNIRFNDHVVFMTPPLFTWLEAASLSVFGLSDFAAKVPAALLGFGTIVLVYFLARELTNDPWVSRLAMLTLLSTQFFMRYATHAMTDVPFAFFCTLAIFLYVKGLSKPVYFDLAGLAVACAIMTRSVLGTIPAGIILGHMAVTRRYDIMKSRHFIGFAALALSLPAIWITSEYHSFGIDFVRAHVSFVLASASDGKRWSLGEQLAQILVYPKFLAQKYWPWLPFMVVSFYVQTRAAITRRDSRAVLLVLWVLCVIVPFCFVTTKYLRYIMAVFPAFAILTAMVLNEWIAARRKTQLFLTLYALGTIFVIYAAVFPMTLLRATDMHQLAPVTDAHTSPQEHILIYSSGKQDWGVLNQLLWYGNRYADLLTDLSDVRSRLESGRSTVVVINTEAAGRLRFALGEGKTDRITVLAQSSDFYCLKYTASPL
jgi:4-amino-4-deoxy-L-arabinose transferase-like glycosyltransferase